MGSEGVFSYTREQGGALVMPTEYEPWEHMGPWCAIPVGQLEACGWSCRDERGVAFPELERRGRGTL